MDGARPRRAVAQHTHTHYWFCSLALANPTLDERAIAQRWCNEYTLATGAADFVEVPRGGNGNRITTGGLLMATQFQVTFDSAEPNKLADFWAAALSYIKQPPPEGYADWPTFLKTQGIEVDVDDASAIVDPSGVRPRVFFQKVPKPKTAKNRMHLDLNGSTTSGRTGRDPNPCGRRAWGVLDRHGRSRRQRVLHTVRHTDPGYWERGSRPAYLFPSSRPCLRGATLGATARPGEAFEANVDSLHILLGAGRPQNIPFAVPPLRVGP